MAPGEHQELRRQIIKLTDKAYLWPSKLPCAVPTLLTPMCVDSRAINKFTIKYDFPIPRLHNQSNPLHGAKMFIKFDLKSGYHQIQMRLGDERKLHSKQRMVYMNDDSCLLVYPTRLLSCDTWLTYSILTNF